MDKLKVDATHVEDISVDAVGTTEVDGYKVYGLVKSRYDELSIPRTLWVFKRVILIVLAVYTGYICEGFEVSRSRFGCADSHLLMLVKLNASGSVVANAGFIKQFGSGGTGVRALSPTWCKSSFIFTQSPFGNNVNALQCPRGVHSWYAFLLAIIR